MQSHTGFQSILLNLAEQFWQAAKWPFWIPGANRIMKIQINEFSLLQRLENCSRHCFCTGLPAHQRTGASGHQVPEYLIRTGQKRGQTCRPRPGQACEGGKPRPAADLTWNPCLQRPRSNEGTNTMAAPATRPEGPVFNGGGLTSPLDALAVLHIKIRIIQTS